MTFAKGEPVQLMETDDNSLSGTFADTIDIPSYNPGNGPLFINKNPRSGQPYFNPNYFTFEPLGQVGNAMRRYFSGPGINNFDLALLKDTKITESTQVQFRAEAFNVFNHAQFNNPSGNINNTGVGGFGYVTSALPARIMQLALNSFFKLCLADAPKPQITFCAGTGGFVGHQCRRRLVAKLAAKRGAEKPPAEKSRRQSRQSRREASRLLRQPAPDATAWTAEAVSARRTSRKIQRCSGSPMRRFPTSLRTACPELECPPSTPSQRTDVHAVVTYLRSLQGTKITLKLPGDPIRGETLFFGKAGCSGCHMAAGKGGFIASDLSGYARGHAMDEIQSVIASPTPVSNGQARMVTATTRAGEKYVGRIRNEDNFSLQLQMLDGTFFFVDKSDIERLDSSQTLMHSDYGSTLSHEELNDLVSYLMRVSGVKPGEAIARTNGFEDP